MLDVIALDARGVSAALVDRDGCGKRVVPDGTSEKRLCRSPVALGGEQEVDGVARFVDRAIQILPLAADFDVRLVHALTRADGSFAFPERPFQDAVLANSGREPFGLVGLEVIAAGGIAVCGATGEEYAEPFVNAIVCDTADGRELATYLRALLGVCRAFSG